jgi:NADPH:quinone reductase-like Zn-dependent oxidoreductase
MSEEAGMQAIVNTEYGPPEELELREVDLPAMDADGVLVRVRAASVNPFDWHVMRGEPYLVRLTEGLRRPKRCIPGIDLAGVVEEVGENVTELRAGDEVFGSRGGAFAEYVRGGRWNFVPKPARLSFEQAAAIPTAAVTALQALRDRVRPGQNVLVNGSAGGVGTFTVQIAKSFDAEVTAVCSTRNIELVRSLGADHVVDYTAEDFARAGRRYDLIVDNVCNRSLSEFRKALMPKGTLVTVGGKPEMGNWISPLVRPVGSLLLSPFVGQRLVPLMAKHSREDLLVLAELAESGKITPVIDRTYPLGEAPDAIRYLEAGHAQGKVVITV